MLVLSRRVGEWIVIDGNIQITVVAVQGARVRLGVVAPDEVSIDRLEVFERRATFAQAGSLPGDVPTDAGD